MNYPLQITLIVFCLLMSAYFSATETAFSTLNKIRIKNLAEDGNKRAKLVYNLTEKYDTMLSAVLIGNNIVNILSSSLATVLFINVMVSNPDFATTVSTVVMTLAVLIFGEITPKTIAKRCPEKFAMFSAPLLKGLMIIFTPFTYIFLFAYLRDFFDYFVMLIPDFANDFFEYVFKSNDTCG